MEFGIELVLRPIQTKGYFLSLLVHDPVEIVQPPSLISQVPGIEEVGFGDDKVSEGHRRTLDAPKLLATDSASGNSLRDRLQNSLCRGADRAKSSEAWQPAQPRLSSAHGSRDTIRGRPATGHFVGKLLAFGALDVAISIEVKSDAATKTGP